jgi:hypothetical protein
VDAERCLGIVELSKNGLLLKTPDDLLEDEVEPFRGSLGAGHLERGGAEELHEKGCEKWRKRSCPSGWMDFFIGERSWRRVIAPIVILSRANKLVKYLNMIVISGI